MRTLGWSIKRTQMRLARELVLDLYPKALTEWGPFVAHFDALDARADGAPPRPLSSSEADDELAAWLEHVRLDDGEDAAPHAHARGCTHSKISTSSVELYRCSWCGNPSAVLRKCGGCGKTRCVGGTLVALAEVS